MNKRQSKQNSKRRLARMRPAEDCQPQIDWARIDAMSDDEIDYSDIPEADEEFFNTAIYLEKEPDGTIVVRIRPSVLKWWQSQGDDYAKRIADVIRMYAESKSD